MPQLALTEEAKANMRANLELELNARKEKLLAMCEAQVASLRSRLERRVNRVPSNKRHMNILDLLNSSLPAKSVPAKKEVAPALASRKTRAAPTTTAPRSAPTRDISKAPATRETQKPAVTKAATKPAPKPTAVTTQPKATRGKKRSSDEMSSEDKENATELAVPKKRTKAVTQKPPAATKAAPAARTTRAASRKVAASAQVLSPKTNNSRPVPATRTRRQR